MLLLPRISHQCRTLATRQLSTVSSRSLSLDEIVAWAKRRGFVWSPPLYGGGGTGYDFGPLGAALKRNVSRAWWADFVDRRADCVPLETALVLSPRVWVASGHVAQFSDPLAECASCRRRVRADKAVAAALGNTKNGNAAAGTSALLPKWLTDARDSGTDTGAFTLTQVGEALTALRVVCPGCGKGGELGLGVPRTFNLLLKTHVGAVEGAEGSVAGGGGAGEPAYLRPETAQGAYIHFLNLLNSTRRRLPLGVGQAGPSFRNEISVGQFLFRTREFDQCELQYFCAPATSTMEFDRWLTFCTSWLTNKIGLRAENIRVRHYEKGEMAHYALATSDIEFKYPFGWEEIWGVSNRGDFDLKAHSKASGVALEYTDPVGGEVSERTREGGGRCCALCNLPPSPFLFSLPPPPLDFYPTCC